MNGTFIVVSELLNLDPKFVRNLSLGQIFSMPFIKERFSETFVRNVVSKHVDQSLDTMDGAFLISMIVDFMKQNRESENGKTKEAIHKIHQCPYCKHYLVLED